MANEAHLGIIRQGVVAWNTWRQQNPGLTPDLSGASLDGLFLRRADFQDANLYQTSFEGCDLDEASFYGANLKEAMLAGVRLKGCDFHQANLRMACLKAANLEGIRGSRADFWRADLRDSELLDAELAEANLSEADLRGASLIPKTLRKASLEGANLAHLDLQGAYMREVDLSHANLQSANLKGADLRGCRMTGTNLKGANLEGCRIYGVSVWNIVTDAGTNQAGLVITHHSELRITVDNLELAQFVHMIMENARITGAVTTLTQKCVLVLGRFARKETLLTICDDLRRNNWLSILFDFAQPAGRTTLETIMILAGMSQFVIADITDPACVFMEIANIARNYPNLPVYPVLAAESPVPGAWEVIRKWQQSVQPLVRYDSPDAVVGAIMAQGSSELASPAVDKARNVFVLAEDERVAQIITEVTCGYDLSPVEEPDDAHLIIADLTEAPSILMQLPWMIGSFPELTVLPLLATGAKVPGMWDSLAVYQSVHEIVPYQIDSLRETLQRTLDAL